jgi:flagellar basal body-associated protein FliL
MKKKRINKIKPLYIIIGLLTFLFILLGSIYLSWKASKDTEKAARKVSLLYLDELS